MFAFCHFLTYCILWPFNFTYGFPFVFPTYIMSNYSNAAFQQCFYFPFYFAAFCILIDIRISFLKILEILVSQKLKFVHYHWYNSECCRYMYYQKNCFRLLNNISTVVYARHTSCDWLCSYRFWRIACIKFIYHIERKMNKL